METLPSGTLSAISLFSGAGGMDVGFRSAGYSIVFANDIDYDACNTYRANHGDIIREGNLADFLPELRRLQDVDVVFGGPPCQGFSIAGKMNPADERNRLIETYLDVVGAVQPKAFVCENVKALAVLERWKSVRKLLLSTARRHYATALLVLNSYDFGVPQSRERMFLIGIRKDVYAGQCDNLEADLRAALSGLHREPPKLREVLRALGRAGSDANKRVCRAKITYAKSPVMRRSPYAGMLFNGAGRPLPPNGRSCTLPASMGGNKTPIVDEAEVFDDKKSYVEEYHAHLRAGGKPFVGVAPPRLRRLTVDECLAIQTFPQDYHLHGSQSSMYRQIGNAVPCALAESVAIATRDLIANTLSSTSSPSCGTLIAAE